MRGAAPLLLSLLALGAAASRRTPPLITDERRVSRTTECHLGKQVHEIGSHWFADLGPPFGIMYCIRCECIAMKKKRRIVARSQCRNIKHECPKPSCDEPVLLPGRCCKICPQDEPFSPDILPQEPSRDNQPAIDDDRRKHFAAVLTASDDAQAPTPVATGRFLFQKRALYYSLQTPFSWGRPSAIHFRDAEGSILSDVPLGVGGMYQRATGKVCGSWKRMPREYRKLLREHKLYVALVWPKFSIAGQVVGHHALGTELFSSLLLPISASGGGTAVVSVHYAPDTSSIHASLLLAGLSVKEGTPVVVRLESDNDIGKIVLEEEVMVSQPAANLSEVEIRSPVLPQDLKLMARGKLKFSVFSKDSSHGINLHGQVTTRVTCEIFQAIMSSANVGSTAVATADGSDCYDPETPTSGIGWFYVRPDGNIVFWAMLHDLDTSSIPMLTLVAPTASSNGLKRRCGIFEIEDLTPSLDTNTGTATGDIILPPVNEIIQLYDGDLSLNVETNQTVSLVRGKLLSKPVADARDGEKPVLLTRRYGVKKAAEIVGMAWVAVDTECTLHFEVSLAGLSQDDRLLVLYLEMIPLLAHGAPVDTKVLGQFNGSHYEDSIMAMPLVYLAKLGYEVCYLGVKDALTGQVLVNGTLKDVKVPTNCQPHYANNDVPSFDPVHDGDEEGARVKAPCYDKGLFREDGAQWPMTGDSCTVCHCRRGKIYCDSVICPAVPEQCPGGEKPVPPAGECCSVCPYEISSLENNTTNRGCFLAGQFHVAGSSWHPYLPPHGFDTCATCSCDPNTLQVRWVRTTCPELHCKPSEAKRPPKSCCKVCPEVVQDQEEIVKVPQTRSVEEVLASGGCKNSHGLFENEQDWHPRIHPFGEEKCITCRCRNGKTHCEKKRCKRSVCYGHRQNSPTVDECCMQCRRNRRPHRTSPHS